jgi:hypothetical protein
MTTSLMLLAFNGVGTSETTTRRRSTCGRASGTNVSVTWAVCTPTKGLGDGSAENAHRNARMAGRGADGATVGEIKHLTWRRA